jgi:hypothetical protein
MFVQQVEAFLNLHHLDLTTSYNKLALEYSFSEQGNFQRYELRRDNEAEGHNVDKKLSETVLEKL